MTISSTFIRLDGWQLISSVLFLNKFSINVQSNHALLYTPFPCFSQRNPWGTLTNFTSFTTLMSSISFALITCPYHLRLYIFLKRPCNFHILLPLSHWLPCPPTWLLSYTSSLIIHWQLKASSVTIKHLIIIFTVFHFHTIHQCPRFWAIHHQWPHTSIEHFRQTSYWMLLFLN